MNLFKIEQEGERPYDYPPLWIIAENEEEAIKIAKENLDKGHWVKSLTFIASNRLYYKGK